MSYSQIVRVQERSGGVVGTSLSLSLSANATAGNLLVVFAGGSGSSITNTTSGWTAVPNGTDVNKAWYRIAVGGGSASDSATITQTGSAPMTGFIMEYSGLYGNIGAVFADNGVSTQTAGSYTSTAGLATSPNNSLGTPNNLIISCVGMKVASGASVPTSPVYSFSTGGGSNVDTSSQTNTGQSGIAMFYGDGQNQTSMPANPGYKVSWTNAATDTNFLLLAFHSAIDPFEVSVGAFSTAATTTITPSFGTATTAGNLLIARVTANVFGSGGNFTQTTITTSASGWTSAYESNDNSHGTAAIFYKPNCSASETAPTFTATGASYMTASLIEAGGCDTASPLGGNQSGSHGTASPLSAQTTSVDAQKGNLVVWVGFVSNSKSATATFSESWSPALAFTETLDDHATKQIPHSKHSSAITASISSAPQNSVTYTPSTGSIAGWAAAIASFIPVQVFASDLAATAVGPHSIKLTWTGGSANVQRSTTGTSGWTTISPTSFSGTYIDNDAPSTNTTYYYKVTSVSTSVDSPVVNATTVSTTYSKNNTWEYGSNGFTVGTTTPTGGDAFASVTSGTATLTTDNTSSGVYQGIYGGRIVFGTDTFGSYTGVPSTCFSMYMRTFLTINTAITASGDGVAVIYTSDGTWKYGVGYGLSGSNQVLAITVKSGTGSAVTLGTVTIPTGQQVRIEHRIYWDGSGATGWKAEGRLYLNKDSTTADDTVTATWNSATTTGLTSCCAGINNVNVATGSAGHTLDYTGFSDDTWLSTPNPITPVSQTRQTLWNANAVVSQNRQELFNTNSIVSKARQELWNSQAIVSQSRQELWNTVARINDITQYLWNTNSIVFQNSQELWNTTGAVTQSRQELWNTVAQITKSRQELWNTIGRVNDVVNYLWNANSVTTKTAQELWNTQSAVAQSRQELWNTAAGVLQSRQELWNTIGRINDVTSYLWNVNSIAAQNRQEIWNTQAVTSQTRQELWTVNSLVSQPRQELWNTRAVASQSRQELWNTIGRVTQSRQELWNTNLIVSQNRQTLWNNRDYEVLLPEDAGFEGGTTGRWFSGGTTTATLANSTAQADTGTHSLLVTWGAGGTEHVDLLFDVQNATGYTMQARVFVPAGSPNVALRCEGVTGTASSGTGSWQTITVNFTSSSTTPTLQLIPSTTPSSGQQVYIDNILILSVTTVSNSKQYLFTTNATVSKSSQDLWNTLLAISIDSTEIWNNLEIVPVGYGLVWNTRSIVSKSRQYLWNTLIGVSKARQELWNTIGQIYQSRQELWAVVGRVNTPTQTLWNTLKTITKTDQTIWNTLISVVQSRQEIWNQQAIASVDATELWFVAEAVSQSRQEIWNTVGQIVKPGQFVWNNTGFVSTAAQELWSTLAGVSTSSQELWNDLISVSQATQEKWSVNSLVSQAKQALWKVVGRVEAPTQYEWTTNEIIASPTQYLWDTLKGVTRSIFAEWNDQSVNQLPISVWNGSAWVTGILRVWTIDGWRRKPTKRWNGSAWV